MANPLCNATPWRTSFRTIAPAAGPPEGVSPEGDFVSVLSLRANQGSVIEIAAEGVDAEAALDALQSLMENNFSLQEKQPDNSIQTNEIR
jgi:hypothetical protein